MQLGSNIECSIIHNSPLYSNAILEIEAICMCEKSPQFSTNAGHFKASANYISNEII